jgi:hypothetical protein
MTKVSAKAARPLAALLIQQGKRICLPGYVMSLM